MSNSSAVKFEDYHSVRYAIALALYLKAVKELEEAKKKLEIRQKEMEQYK